MFKKTRENSPYFNLAVDFGYTLLAAIGLFGYLGYWLDQRYGTKPWLMMIGIFLGLAVGFNGLFRGLSMVEARQKAARKRSQEKPPEPRD